MGASRKTVEPQKPGNFPALGPELVERQKVAREQAAQIVRSWTVQNEMRGAWDECLQALQEGFSILPILER